MAACVWVDSCFWQFIEKSLDFLIYLRLMWHSSPLSCKECSLSLLLPESWPHEALGPQNNSQVCKLRLQQMSCNVVQLVQKIKLQPDTGLMPKGRGLNTKKSWLHFNNTARTVSAENFGTETLSHKQSFSTCTTSALPIKQQGYNTPEQAHNFPTFTFNTLSTWAWLYLFSLLVTFPIEGFHF